MTKTSGERMLENEIHKCYSDSNRSRSKFIKLVRERTGLTETGLKKQGWLDTLVFKKK